MDIYKELFLMQQTYATLFSLANKIQVKGDKSLELLTSRQHMAMVAIAHLPEDETTLNNIARKLGTTKQSVKQLITIMEELFKKFSTEELEIMWKLLKKLYSFDGEEHDGFEEEGNIKMDDDHNELQVRVIRELESRRVQAIDNMRKNI